MAKEKWIECRECGASILEKEAKCPYCGAFQLVGAEAEYQEKLQGVKHDLEKVGTLPDAMYKKEWKKWGKVACVSGAIAVFFLIVTLIGTYIIQEFSQKSYQYDELRVREIEKELFPVLDELYDADDYEGILEQMDLWEEDEQRIAFSRWEHSNFMTLYDYYQLCLEFSPGFVDKKTVSGSVVELTLDGVFQLRYALEYANKEGSYYRLKEKELELIAIYYEETNELLQKDTGLSETEINLLYLESIATGYVDYFKIVEQAEGLRERWKAE